MKQKIFFVFLTLSLICPAVFAQTPPTSQSIGAVDQQQKALEEQRMIEKQIETKRKKPQIEEEKPAEAPAIPEGKKVLIKTIIVEGVTLLSDKDLKAVISQYEGKELYLSEMQKVADLITDIYRKQGHTTSRAYLPPQTIKDGILTIKIIEGIVGKIEVKGNRYFKTSTLEKKIKLKSKDYFNYSTLQKGLTYINENPDRTAKAILVPGEMPGTTDIIIEVKDRLPIHLGFDYDNFGSRYMEKNRWSAVYENNNFLGFDDRLFFKLQMSQKSLYNLKNASYIFPVNDTLQVGGYFTHSRLILGKEFRALSAVGKSTIIGTFLNKTLVSNRVLDLRYNFGFDYKDIKNYLLGAESSRDEMRVVKNGLDIDITDKFGRTIITPELDIGIPNMWGGLDDKDPRASRLGAGGKFVKGVFNFYRLQPMPFSTSLLLKNTAQLSNYNLVAAEQFQIGGAQSVRGYGPGEYAGDKGIYSSAEWSFPAYFLSKNVTIPFSQEKLYNALRFVCFYDWANARLKSPGAGEEKSQTLRGWGYGLRFNIKDLSLRFELGYPLGKKPSDGNNAHPWVEFSCRF
ncbi:MAG: ShlB/FhaC/HecB family hemolysin secretion/activation protein [Candidatus Omnitrophota bacterium]|jgi:hemolysin activation/secretion protein